MSESTKIEMGHPPSFPLDIVEDILSRVPVVCLLQLRCVCKSWRSLIDSEGFIKFHLKRSTDDEFYSYHRIILMSHDRVLRIFNWTTLFTEEPLPNPLRHDDFKSIKRDVQIVGCCSGLVCLMIQDRGRFILWNPATRMSLDLPNADIRPLSIMGINPDKFPMYGFAYVDDDFNVFTIVHSYTFVMRPPIARLYSLKSYSWKTLKIKHFPSRGDTAAGVFMRGNLHWFGDKGGIVSFYFKNEAFGVVELPNFSDHHNIRITKTLGVMDGCLSVLCDYPDSHFHVWVMKEYGLKESWVKLYTLSNVNHPPLRTQRVSSFSAGPIGEVLLMYYSCFLMFHHYTHYDDALHCSFIFDTDPIMREGCYVESLVSLGPDAEEESF